MRQLLNQHSFLVAALLLVALGWGLTFKLRRSVRLAVAGALAVAAVVAFAVLRTGAGDVRAASDLDAALASGKPVALELYSDY